MNKRETLVILTPGFPADKWDTTCIPPQQLFVKALKKQRPGLHLIILSLQYPYNASNYNWHGTEVIAFGGRNRGKLNRLALWAKVWKTLTQLNHEYEITGLFSFWLGECALIGNRFARKHKLQHYCWMLGQDARPGNNYVKLMGAKGDGLIALSDQLAQEFNTNYGILPAHIIPPGIDISEFGRPAKKRDIDLIGVGSLIPLKQYPLFIDIVKKLAFNFPDMRAVICGKGPEMESLQQQVKWLRLEDNIELKGELPYREALALMQQSKILLHTSAYEGFGMVLCEALYAGAHVVSLVKPMDEMPAEFHHIKNKDDIIEIISALLKNNHLNHDQVLTYQIDTIAEKVAGLFDR